MKTTLRTGEKNGMYKHGMSHTRFNVIFKNMNRRCYYEKNPMYYRYGARGIKVEWDSMVDFIRDMYPSYLEHSKLHGEKDTEIDRLDINKNYSKENCRWTTQMGQGQNKSNNRFVKIGSRTNPLSVWLREKGIEYTTFRDRMGRGMSEIEALTVGFRAKSARYHNCK